MSADKYLLDTHALYFWNTKQDVTADFIKFFDAEQKQGNVLVSSICFWEISLLAIKGKIEIENVKEWKNNLINFTNLILVNPSVDNMIESTLLPKKHKDPFDRLLIAQAKSLNALLVTKDKLINRYDIKTFWI